MSVIVSQGISRRTRSSGHTDSGDVVVSGGSMFVLSAGVASATTVSSGGFLTINKGGSGSGSHLSGGNETISGTETGGFIESGGSQRVLAPGKAISTTVDSSGTLTVLSGGTASAAIVNNGGNMLVAKGGVVAGVTINAGAVVSNAGIVKANSALSAVIGGVVTNANTIEALGSGGVVKIFGSITDTGTVLASGNGAHVELDGGAAILGGKLQTLAGGKIDANNGVLSGVTIASGSIVDINNNGTLALSGRIANSGLISALGSPSFATLAISGAVVLSGGGKVSLSPSGNNQIVAAPGGGTLSNVNNTIAGAGFIGGGGLAVVNSGAINANTVSSTLFLNANTINAGKLEATASGGTLILGGNISNTGTGTILASGSGAHVVLTGAFAAARCRSRAPSTIPAPCSRVAPTVWF
jgi:autotransporter passenger strand-loop-strand repeat protein